MKLIKKLFAFFWDKSLLIFAIIGAANTVVSMAGSFLLENYAGLHTFFAMALMFALCSVPSFYFNRKYSFKSKGPLAASILRFATVITACFLLSFGINQLALPWLRANLFPGVNPLLYSFIRIVCVQALFTILNYAGQRMWAFKSSQPSPAAPCGTK